jgi:hypothetical protein
VPGATDLGLTWSRDQADDGISQTRERIRATRVAEPQRSVTDRHLALTGIGSACFLATARGWLQCRK